MSQCPLKMSDVASLPHSLYNFSYYPLFPGPFCKGCGHATVNGKCVDVFNDRQKVMTSSVQTSSSYGQQNIQNKNGENVTVNRLLGPVACSPGYHSINGHCTLFGPQRNSGYECPFQCSPH
jgi:hypothetical protein